jgi:hypothetical protein
MTDEPRPSGFDAALREWQESELRSLFVRMAKSGGGEILRMENSKDDQGQEHPAGGCNGTLTLAAVGLRTASAIARG